MLEADTELNVYPTGPFFGQANHGDPHLGNKGECVYKSAEAWFWTADDVNPHIRDVRRLDMPTMEGPRPADHMARNRSDPNQGMSFCHAPAADGL